MDLSGRHDGQCELECQLRHLREVPFFGGLAPDLLRVIAYLCEKEKFAPGHDILTTGEPAEAAVVVIAGTAVVLRGPHRIATVSAGACAGGMALLGRFQWLYTLRAETGVECLLLPRRKILPQLLAQPDALALVAQELIDGVVRWDRIRLERTRDEGGEGPGML